MNKPAHVIPGQLRRYRCNVIPLPPRSKRPRDMNGFTLDERSDFGARVRETLDDVRDAAMRPQAIGPKESSA